MKTILAGNDFSPAAQNACAYALQLAKAFNARLIIVHAYQPVVVPVMETGIDVTPEELIRNTKEEMQKTEDQFNNEGQPKVETHVRQGAPADILLQVAREVNAGLIITGMKKSNHGLRRFFGSTVTDLVQKSNTPLLVVPEEAPYVPITTIALANDSDAEAGTDAHLLDALRKVAEKFHSRLYLVRVAANQYLESFEIKHPPVKLKQLVRDLNPVYETVEGGNTEKALNQFIHTHQVNLLAMLPRKHSLMDRWFYKSTTRAMVFEASVPLLLMPHRGH